MSNNIIQFSDNFIADKTVENLPPYELLYHVARSKPEQVMVMSWYKDSNEGYYSGSVTNPKQILNSINEFMEGYYKGDLERYKFEPTEIELEAAIKAIRNIFMVTLNQVIFEKEAAKLAEVALIAAAKARNGVYNENER